MEVIARDGVMASFAMTKQTPVTVPIAEGSACSSTMGDTGAREPDLDPMAVEAAYDTLVSRPVWVLLASPGAGTLLLVGRS